MRSGATSQTRNVVSKIYVIYKRHTNQQSIKCAELALKTEHFQSMHTTVCPGPRTSTGQRSFAAYGSRTWNGLLTALRSPELSLGLFKLPLKTHSSVPALDSAGCSCVCRVPSSHRRCCDCTASSATTKKLNANRRGVVRVN